MSDHTLPALVTRALGRAGTTLDGLLEQAARVATFACAPASGFRVGAVVLDATGTISTGVNVESASFGLTCCAERCALFSHLGAGWRHPVLIAVACIDGDPSQPATLMPCGACRQVMSEHLDPGGVVAVRGVGVFSVDELLPMGFCLPRPA